MMIGKRISEIRAEKGLSQEGLAELTGLSKKTIGRWERGETVPSTNDLEYLLEKLNVSHGEFYRESAQTEVVKAASVTFESNETEANEQWQEKIETERETFSKRKMWVIMMLIIAFSVFLVISAFVFFYYSFFGVYLDHLIFFLHANEYIKYWGEVLFIIGSLIIIFCLIALIKIKKAGQKKP